MIILPYQFAYQRVALIYHVSCKCYMPHSDCVSSQSTQMHGIYSIYSNCLLMMMNSYCVRNMQRKYYKSKSKGVPRQAEVAQEVPAKLRHLTFRHYKGGRSSTKRTGRLYPRRNPWYSLSEIESTSGHMVLSGVPRKKSPVTPPGIDPGTVRLVAQCLNHYATPGPPIAMGH